jgi:hypothetical protein
MLIAKKTTSALSGLLWERQPRESDEAWEAFRLYLSLGSGRSYEKVRQQLGKSRTIIERWGRRWNWQERICARDNWLLAEENKAQKSEARKRAINRGKLHDHAYKAQANYILYLSAKDPSNLTPPEANYLMRAGDTLYRDHKEMFALDAQGESQKKFNEARIDLEVMKLEAQQIDPPTEGGTNFEEALRATVPDVWEPEHPDGKDDSKQK